MSLKCYCGLVINNPQYPVHCICGRRWKSRQEFSRFKNEVQSCCGTTTATGPKLSSVNFQATHCQYRKIPGSEDVYLCVKCRHTTNRPVQERVCGEAVKPPAGLISVSIIGKAEHFIVSLAHLAVSKFKFRTKKEIKDIWVQHCSQCEYYDPIEDQCMSCGCNINLHTADKALNKLAWKTEPCPQDKFTQ